MPKAQPTKTAMPMHKPSEMPAHQPGQMDPKTHKPDTMPHMPK